MSIDKPGFADQSSAVAVCTTHGTVVGVRDEQTGIRSFKGIPYARPPLGALRWRAPVTSLSWDAPFDASRFSAAGAQPLEFGGIPEQLSDDPATARSVGWLGSEDCLTLNVWTRHERGAKRPVMIWIHGGANWLESSRAEAYSGAPLARDNDLVVFSINYRLGIFGFLDVGVLGDPSYAGTHSLGLRDQQLAIEWIHANAEYFGGDPAKITLVGESAGSMDISWHLTTGQLPKDIRRVALMSGIAGVPGFAQDERSSFYSASEGRRDAGELFASMNIDSMPQLLQATTADLMERFVRVLPTKDMLFQLDSMFYPRVDAAYTPRTPFEHVISGRAHDVEMLIGTTNHEVNLWLTYDQTLARRSPLELATSLRGVSPELAGEMVEQHRTWCAPNEPGGPGSQLLSDAMFVMPSLLIADAHARNGGKTWFYRYCRELPDPRMGAAHAADIGFFLGSWDSAGGDRFYGIPANEEERSARDALARFMMGSLAAFVETGNPDFGAGDVRWPAYALPERMTMRLDDDLKIESDPVGVRRKWWLHRVYKQPSDV